MRKRTGNKRLSWDQGFYSGVTAALAVVTTMDGNDSTMFREIVKSVGAEPLVQHADETDLEMFAASDLTSKYINRRKPTGRGSTPEEKA